MQTKLLSLINTQVNITKKVSPAIDQFLNPILALLNDDNDDLLTSNDEQAMAQDNLTEAQRERLYQQLRKPYKRKNYKEIEELLFFQETGCRCIRGISTKHKKN